MYILHLTRGIWGIRIFPKMKGDSGWGDNSVWRGLLHRRKDLNSDPQHLHQRLGMAAPGGGDS